MSLEPKVSDSRSRICNEWESVGVVSCERGMITFANYCKGTVKKQLTKDGFSIKHFQGSKLTSSNASSPGLKAMGNNAVAIARIPPIIGTRGGASTAPYS